MAVNLGTVIALIKTYAPDIDPESVESAVSDWLDDHPEATTTVEDGSITEEKLASALALKLNTAVSDISDVESAITPIEEAITREIKSKNLIDPSKLIAGRVNSTGGIASSGLSTYKTLDYTWLEPGSYIFAREKLSDGTAYTMQYSGYCLYDANKDFISGSNVWDNFGKEILSITIAQACYIRLSGAKESFTEDTTARFILQKGTALDGYEAYHDPYTVVIALTKNDIEQTSGQQTDKVMSQKAVTDLVNSLEPEIPEKLEEIKDAFYYQVGKNKYNPTACNPENEKLYDVNNSGAIKSGDGYAITGKIPVEEKTRYVFSAGGANVYRAFFFGGNDGSVYIGATDSGLHDAPFVTPDSCTFVGLSLFAASHTTQEYETAIASGQLEIGGVPTAFEAYKETITLPTDNVKNGNVLDTASDVIVTQSQINFYDKTLVQDNVYFNTQSHAVISNSEFAFSGYVPVMPNAQYNISRDVSTTMKLAGAVYLFDEDKEYLGSASKSNYVYGWLLAFQTTSATKYIAFNMTQTDSTHTDEELEELVDSLMLCYGTQRPLTYSPYNPEPVVLAKKLSDSYTENRDCFTGKKWLATGTSITWYDSKTYEYGVNAGEICRGYVGNVARRKKLLVTNEGISGSTLAGSGDSALISRYQSLDWANTDIATIEYGVNDFGNAIAIGTADDAPGTDTFAACLKTIIEYAMTQNPHLCLVICTEPDVRGSTANSGGHYLYEYTDVTLAIAKQYRLPVCDWFYHSGINSINKGSSSYDYMTADGTHPNDQGHMRMGAMLNQVFDSLIC